MKYRLFRRLALFQTVFSATASTALGATAQAPMTRARLLVEAEPDCATEAAVAERVRARSRQIAFASSEAKRSVRAVIAREPAGNVSARLLVRHGDRRSERQLEAGSCDEAIEALALLIALALDPSAAPPTAPPVAAEPLQPRAAAPSPARSSGRSAVAPEPPPAPETPPAPPAAPADELAAAEAVAQPAPEPARAAPDVLEQPPSPEKSASLVLTAAVEGRGVLGPAPRPLPGVGLSVMLAWERDSIWSAAVGLTALHSWLSGVQEASGRAAFQLQLVRLDACVVRVRLGPAAVRGCASAALGRLHASGSDTYEPDSHTRFFAALGGAAVFQLELGAHLGLSAVASLGRPLTRDSFAFRPEVFHRVSSVVVDLGIGAGVRFP